MPTILLHSSKTMRPHSAAASSSQAPALLHDARALHECLRTLGAAGIKHYMQVSDAKAHEVAQLIESWTGTASAGRPAIDAFLGDIYSGLQVRTLTQADRTYANNHLIILSGLYGGLRALDSIEPYRLEMGYKIPIGDHKNLYEFWGNRIADILPSDNTIINLSAVEYTKAVLPFVENKVVITPKFMTISPKTGLPVFVTVHAKIARGAFAHWLVTKRITNVQDLSGFDELGYCYDNALSTAEQPVYVAKEFQGLGLSVRLT